MNFTKDSIIIDVLDQYPEAKDIMERHGLYCVLFGCPHTLSETLETACQVHEVNLENLLTDLNNR